MTLGPLRVNIREAFRSSVEVYAIVSSDTNLRMQATTARANRRFKKVPSRVAGATLAKRIGVPALQCGLAPVETGHRPSRTGCGMLTVRSRLLCHWSQVKGRERTVESGPPCIFSVLTP